MLESLYRTAFLDWLACAVAGSRERAAVAARGADADMLGCIAAIGTAGHVLDFDDTYAPGLAHCTAPTAPAALVLGARSDATLGDVLEAYAVGFETMAALAGASHPELYRRGWHPTAVCGAVAAAAAAAAILGLEDERTATALNLSLLQAAGLRSAFGSDGKAVQVGLAGAAGARAAFLASAGALVGAEVRTGFESAYGATWADPDPARPAIRENWIKAYPCCLQTHSAIEAADIVRASGPSPDGLTVRVHPVSLQAARIGIPSDPLQAKFSIPYTVAFTLLNGPPHVEDFSVLHDDALHRAGNVEVRTDPSLGESEAVLEAKGIEPIRVRAALGSPQRPMDEEALRAKVRSLAGDDVLFDDSTPARDVLGIVTA